MPVPRFRTAGRNGLGWLRFVGAGFELATLTLLFALVGLGFDKWHGNARHLGTGLGSMLGFSLGMVRFIVSAMQANRASTPPIRETDAPGVERKPPDH